jgi:hypothetical protein
MLSIKNPLETITVTFDFSALTTSVASPSVTSVVSSGAVDPTPSAILSGSPQISGAKVLQKIVAGLPGAYYELLCQITAADGSVYVLSEVLPVISI